MSETVLIPAILSTAYSEKETSVKPYGVRVVALWVNVNTYRQIRKYCRHILDVPETDEIVTKLTQENLGMIWGAVVGISPTIPDNSLLLLSEKDAPFEVGQVPNDSMLFRY
jgi:hypothetical protein